MRINVEQAADILKSANTIIIAGHTQPDGDCLGSMLAMHILLTKLGKDARMIMADDIAKHFTFLPAISNIEKPQTETLTADLLVLLDIDLADRDRLSYGNTSIIAPVLNIDHHPTNKLSADYILLDSDMAATAQLVMLLVLRFLNNVPADIATCLYTGIASDCGFFRHQNTNAEVFALVTQLTAAGADIHAVADNLQVVSRHYVKIFATVLMGVEYYFNGQVAIAVITAEQLAGDNIDTADIVSFIRSIDSVSVAVIIKQLSSDFIRTSFRSRQYDVGRLAASFGGGGHKLAAGCGFRDSSIAEVKTKLLKALADGEWRDD